MAAVPVDAGAGRSVAAVVPGAPGRAGNRGAGGCTTETVGAEIKVVSCRGELAGKVAGRLAGPVSREEEAIAA
jgi:hypothetical protein